MSSNTPTHRLDALFTTLAAAHVLVIRIAFSGGGDEGGADEIAVSYADGHSEIVTTWWQTDLPWVRDVGDLPHWLYSGFDGEFSVDGELCLDVRRRTVSVTARERGFRIHPVAYDTPAFIETVTALEAQRDAQQVAVHARLSSESLLARTEEHHGN
jgi:hypothetical protein